jgi:hypothetical protein
MGVFAFLFVCVRVCLRFSLCACVSTTHFRGREGKGRKGKGLLTQDKIRTGERICLSIAPIRTMAKGMKKASAPAPAMKKTQKKAMRRAMKAMKVKEPPFCPKCGALLRLPRKKGGVVRARTAGVVDGTPVGLIGLWRGLKEGVWP